MSASRRGSGALIGRRFQLWRRFGIRKHGRRKPHHTSPSGKCGGALKSPGTLRYTRTHDDATEQPTDEKTESHQFPLRPPKAKIFKTDETFEPAKGKRRKDLRTSEKTFTGKDLHEEKTCEAAGSHLGPNSESRATKDPRGTMATPLLTERPTKKAKRPTTCESKRGKHPLLTKECPTEISLPTR